MNEVFNPDENYFLLLDESQDENNITEETKGDDFFIDSEEEENARYQEIIRELTELEERYSESFMDE